MSFHHFKGIWVIKDVTSSSTETIGHRIAIGGRTGNVLILCADNARQHIYARCSYDEAADKLIGPDFEITRTAGQPEILTLSSPSSPINTGSWTAEDPGGWDGDGHDA